MKTNLPGSMSIVPTRMFQNKIKNQYFFMRFFNPSRLEQNAKK